MKLRLTTDGRREMPRLLKLLQDNADRPRALRILAGAEEATVYLYDAIGDFYGTSAVDFARELAAISAPLIHLRVNSPGGDVFEARAMATALRQHHAKVIAHIDGVAASAATTVALAANEVEMSDGAAFMIHDSWALQIGNSRDMLDMAALLEQTDTGIRADYMRKTGASEAKVKAWMDAETWFTAAEALDAGFIDRIFTGEEETAAAGRWNLSAYNNTPEALKEREPEKPPYDRAALERRLQLLENLA